LNVACIAGASLALAARETTASAASITAGSSVSTENHFRKRPNHSDSRFSRAPEGAVLIRVREEAELIWTYIGEKRKVPAVPPLQLPWIAAPEKFDWCFFASTSIATILQIWEGGADSSHVGV